MKYIEIYRQNRSIFQKGYYYFEGNKKVDVSNYITSLEKSTHIITDFVDQPKVNRASKYIVTKNIINCGSITALHNL